MFLQGDTIYNFETEKRVYLRSEELVEINNKEIQTRGGCEDPEASGKQITVKG